MTGEDPEALRRRLYRHGASAADVDAYRAVSGVREPPTGPPRRRRTPVAAVVVPVTALLAAAVSLVVLQPAAPAAHLKQAATVDVQRAAVVASTTELERDGFVRALAGRGPVGLLDWLRTRGRLAGSSSEVEGRGRRTLPLDLPRGGGRVEVLLVADRTASVSWTLLTGAGRGVPVDERSLYVTPGDVAEGVLRYRADRVPARLLVTAPPEVRWGAAVVADR